jgi:hypothetical protein
VTQIVKTYMPTDAGGLQNRLHPRLLIRLCPGFSVVAFEYQILTGFLFGALIEKRRFLVGYKDMLHLSGFTLDQRNSA